MSTTVSAQGGYKAEHNIFRKPPPDFPLVTVLSLPLWFMTIVLQGKSTVTLSLLDLHLPH